MARAEIALRAENPESAVEWAQRAIEIAGRTRRRKYEGRAATVLGEAFARLGRSDEALRALQTGIDFADELVGPPARWSARAALGRAAYALVERFASTLKPERATRLLEAAPIEEILSLTGRTGGR